MFEKSITIKAVKLKFYKSCVVLLTEIVAREGWVLKLIADLLYILICASEEKDSFQMHKFFLRHIVDHVDEENFFLQDLSPRVYHGNND